MISQSYAIFAFNVLATKLKKQKVQLPLSKFTAIDPDTESGLDVTKKYPLFVTWNIFDERYNDYILRGCIGTFSAKKPLEKEIESYALTAAFNDHRFNPITLKELPRLECGITILSNFEEAKDAMDWELGTHGIILSLPYHGQQLSATFLPDVAVEQEWTKEETLIQLARKAGAPIKDVSKIVESATLTRYQGSKTKASYSDYEDTLKLVQKTDSQSE